MNSKNVVFLVLLVIVALMSSQAVAKRNKTYDNNRNSTKWKQHKKKLNLTILNEDLDKKAFENFEKKEDLIEEHNSRPDKKIELGFNDFSHLSKEEIDSKLKGLVIQPQISKRGISSPILYSSFNGVKLSIPWLSYVSTVGYVAPASVDWRTRGFNTPIRSQSPCGSCWAFASAAALEAQISISLKQSVTLSPQLLTDCAGGVWGNKGCNGGFSVTAYNYIYNKSISTESYYPFNGKENTCTYTGANDKTRGNLFTVTQMLQSKAGDDAALMELLDKYGPVSIAMDSSSDYFSSYRSGIFASPSSPAGKMCNASNIDHAMLLVGYGVNITTKERFWIIKNTWGASWGEGGYIRVSREVTNNCGISKWGIVPIASNGAVNPTTTTKPTPTTTTTTPTTKPITVSTIKSTTTVGTPASSLICDGNVHADPGCKTGYSCGYITTTTTCTGGMWSAASTTSTCGQSYASCTATAAFAGCKSAGVFLAASCSQRIQCILSKYTYTAPAGYLLDETGPLYRTGWTCPI